MADESPPRDEATGSENRPQQGEAQDEAAQLKQYVYTVNEATGQVTRVEELDAATGERKELPMSQGGYEGYGYDPYGGYGGYGGGYESYADPYGGYGGYGGGYGGYGYDPYGGGYGGGYESDPFSASLGASAFNLSTLPYPCQI